MCTTTYIQERAEELEKEAQGKIEIIDALIVQIAVAHVAASDLPRAGALIATLLGMHAELCTQKATALRVIEEACALRRQTQELEIA